MEMKFGHVAMSTVLLIASFGCSPNATVDEACEDGGPPGLTTENVYVITGSGLTNLRIGDQTKNAVNIFGKGSASSTGYMNFPKHGISIKYDENDKITRLFYYYRLPDYAVFNGRTQAGIGPASTVKDVIDAYGEPSKRGASIVSEFGVMPGANEESLSFETEGLMFTFWDDKLADVRSTGLDQ